MGPDVVLILTLMNLSDRNPETNTTTIFGRIMDVDEPDSDTIEYQLVDPSGADDSILYVTVRSE